MSSNIKAKSAAKESPTEPFKRAVTGCLRAIARKPELEVTFAAERPGLVGGKVRLPEPPRKLTAPDAAIVRGHADSIALKLACHDPAVHRKLVPGGQQARAVFEAVEQARVEAIGARRMAGVANNLAAMLDDRFHRGKFDEVTDRADAPIEEARRPDGARAADRPGAAAGGEEARRAVAAVDRGPRRPRPRPAGAADRGPARLRRRRPRSARLARHGRGPLAESETRRTARRASRTAARTRPARTARPPTPRTCRRMSVEEAEASAEDMSRPPTRGGRRAGRRDGRRRRDGRCRDAGRAVAAAPARPERAARPGLPAVHRQASTRWSRPRICASRRSSTGCAAISTSSSRTCRAWSRASPTGCSAG